MEIIVIIRNEYPILLRKIKASELERDKCKARYIKHLDSLLERNPNAFVYAKVLNNGDFDYRKRSKDKLEYRFYDIKEHEIKEHVFKLPKGRKVIL